MKNMKKRKSPKEVIEMTRYPKFEHSFIKYSREEPIPTSIVDNGCRENLYQTEEDFFKDYSARLKHPFRKFSGIHTHVVRCGRGEYIDALPSDYDIYILLEDKREKASIIAQHDPDTGKVEGYTIIRKTKKTPKKVTGIVKNNTWKDETFAEYRRAINSFFKDKINAEELDEHLLKILDKYHLQRRFVPADGYKLSGYHFQRKR